MDTGGEVDDAARALAEVDAIRRRVINVVGHALRTPITTMAGMATALAAADDDQTRAVLVDGLVRNGRRVEALLDDLLLAAGVNTALPVEPAAPTPMAEAVQSAWHALGEAERLEVHGAQASAMARPGAVGRILQALLDNARTYGHGGIAVRVDESNATVQVHIESMGDSPTDEELRHAFELFYRGEHAVTTAPGLGIGLPVARELARAEGGDVTLERRGEVVVATVELPR